MTSFNGHMAKRTGNNIKDGMTPDVASDSTLFEFRGATKDARIGSACLMREGSVLSAMSVNYLDEGLKQ